jgi:hypothetical protein
MQRLLARMNHAGTNRAVELLFNLPASIGRRRVADTNAAG